MFPFASPQNPPPFDVSRKVFQWGQEVTVGKSKLQIVNPHWIRFRGGWLHPSLDNRDRWDGNAFAAKAFVWEAPGQKPEKINLKELQDEWLKHDSYWGGSVAAKSLRYLDSRSALGVFISECVSGPSGDDLGVLNFHNLGSSTGDLAYQYLVRIDLHPLRIIRIQPLKTIGSSEIPGTEARHFYPTAKHLYFIDGSKINLVTWKKPLFKPVAQWDRTRDLTAFCGMRWILTTSMTPNSWDVNAFDLNTLKSFTAIRSSKADKTLSSSPRDVSLISGYILWERRREFTKPGGVNNDWIESFFTIHLPDRSTVPVSGHADTVTGAYALNLFNKPFAIYNAKTGKKIYLGR